MGRQKKSELDAVLEQLKMSYASGLNDDLEDSLLDTDDADDAELSSILEKIFAVDDKEGTDTAMSKEEIEMDTVKSEEKKVDEVFDIMFSKSHRDRYDLDTEDIPNTCENSEVDMSPIAEKISESEESSESRNNGSHNIEENNGVEGSVETEEICEVEESNAFNYTAESVNDTEDVYLNDEKKSSFLEKNTDENSTHDSEQISSEQLIKYIKYSEPIVSVGTIDFDFGQIEDKDIVENNGGNSDDAAIVLHEEKNDEYLDVIPDTVEYIHDQLQQSLQNISFFKPQKDIDFTAFYDLNSDVDTSDAVDEVSETVIDSEDKDISLLMKFGYEREISENGQGDLANRVIFKKSKDYIPASHKIKHGFTGAEFSDLSQATEIKKKYKSDRLALMIKAIIVSVVSLIVVLINVASVFLSLNIDTHSIIISILTFFVLIILGNRVYSGIISLIRFDANEYSLPSVILMEYFLLDVSMNIIRSASSESIGYICCGGYALICMAFTVWSEFLDCCREENIFYFISDGKTKYVAEKHISRNTAQNRYIIKCSDFVCGYHQKNIENTKSNVNPFVIVGLLPMIAATTIIASAIINNEPFAGLNFAVQILLFSVPLSSAAGLSVVNFFEYMQLKKISAFYIGPESYDKMTKTESLVFEDTDALKITSFVEIDPNNNRENQKKWLNIAYSIFAVLDGPLSKIIPAASIEGSNIDHDISINSISYNGIDLHFDSSVHVLMGDRQYMLSHNIKVKTNINLTGAMKGSERSVIYMAFDKIPRVGFIVNSRLKQSFIDNIELLHRNNISTEVRSYEPEVNEYYFELNDIKYPISVEKPAVFESGESAYVTDSNIVASNPEAVCRAVIFAKQAEKSHKLQKRILKIQAISACAVASIAAILSFMPLGTGFSEFLCAYSSILLYAISFIMIIPNIVQAVKIIKRKIE